MTSQAILLLLCSAVLHASWNLLSKRSYPSTAFFFWASSIGVLATAPLLLGAPALTWAVLQRVGGLLVLTGGCMAGYYAALAGAYRHGVISIAYPLARALPILLVSAFSV